MASSTGWIYHIEAWQRSGLKHAAYCRQQNLNYHTFSARLGDYRKGQKSSLPVFIQIQIPTSATGPIVLKHGKGRQLDLPISISAS